MIDLAKYETALKRRLADNKPMLPVMPVPNRGSKSAGLLKALDRNRQMAKELYGKYARMAP